jgi:2,4-dienoyl-CoA reductase-like NADH-dependent reductase (Old Yellow Enzyme family)
LLFEIISRIRAQVPSSFIIAVKLNAADYVAGGLSEEEALGHIVTIAKWRPGVDIIEISGGDYENPGKHS